MVFRRVTVGTAVKQLVPYNPKRDVLVIFNNGTVNIYIHDSATAVLTEGLPIPPSSSISFVRAWGDEPETELWVVADAENQDVRIYESIA
jgi:DNA-binding beta-propeller fold protein YncE